VSHLHTHLPVGIRALFECLRLVHTILLHDASNTAGCLNIFIRSGIVLVPLVIVVLLLVLLVVRVTFFKTA